MVRRLFVATLMLGVLASAVPANADTQRVRFRGQFAFADWRTSDNTFAVVSYAASGDHLVAYIEYQTSGGGYYSINAGANLLPYGSFTMNRLDSAHLEGTDVPSTRCDYEANGDLIGCSAVTLDLDVSWTGFGRSSRTVTTYHTTSPSNGFVSTFHATETVRAALASGTINGTSLSTDDLSAASLAAVRSGSLTVCVGGC